MIRKSVGLILFSLMVASLAVAQRLPEIATPTNYKLHFAPDFDHNNFAGEETISVNVLKPTNEIVLNAAEIDFGDVSVSSAGSSQKAKVSLDKDKEMATLTFDQAIQPGAATIQIRYTGILNDELRGLYLGKESNGKKYAATQFESTDARRAYPSFDEPAYKATFDLSVTTDKDLTGISNTSMISDTAGPGEGKHTMTFGTTAKMSSYLVALVVGDFEYIEDSADGIPIRVYTLPGKKETGRLALVSAKHCIQYYDKYFGIPYAFKKLDLIALPDFSAGAMENTGAITYREILLLADEKHASVQQQQNIALVTAHEIAHQWFGDLVTMKWWDDVWLNEGFATWMETKPIAAWKPEWHLELSDVLDTNNSLNVDALENTRPIHQAAETPGEIQELFDGIAYGKAASVLRMLEAYLGPDTFRAGVSAYVKAHSYNNATAEDFWQALTKASGKPVDKIMPTFVNQPGAPMVALQSQCAGKETKVSLSQQRYFNDRKLFEAGSPELWLIPVCMKAQGADGKVQEKCELLDKKQGELNFSGCSSWVLANANATGYYRSGYDAGDTRALGQGFETKISPAERIRLLTDIFASVRVNKQPISDLLSISSLGKEHSSDVMAQGRGFLVFMADNLVTDADQQSYRQWVRGIFAPLGKELGWQPKPGENDDTKTLRANVLSILGYAGRDPEVLDQARKLADQALADPNVVDPTLAHTVFSLAALNGDAAFYDQIFDHLKNAKSPALYYLYSDTLASFTDPKLLSRTLEYALGPDVRSQDAPHVVARVMQNVAGQRVAWDFVVAHWPEIEKMSGGFAAGSIVASAGSVCEAGLRDDVTSFLSEHKLPAAERTVRQTLERMNGCVDLKSQQSAPLAAWLQQGRSTNVAGE